MMNNLFKTISIFVLTTFFLNNILAQCNLNDWTALKQIYLSTEGDNWSNNTNWNLVLSNSPPANCNLESMHGISLGTTGSANGRVMMIDLRSNNLKGIIPPEVGLLAELDEMQIYRNQLVGEIPVEIGQLNKLTIIALDNNLLSGKIPPEIGDLSNLNVLILNNNTLTGPIPEELGDLNNLVELELFNNQLFGCFNSNLSNLCNQLYYNDGIDSGNNFNTTWVDFCVNQAGTCSSNCANNLLLSGNSSTAQTYQVNQAITSTANIQANISYLAGSYILLEDGFTSSAEYNFEANIQNCN